jgi:hypothetical protein
LEGVEMQNHEWVAGVLEDLLSYSEQHDLTVLVDALTAAAAAAESLVHKVPVTSMLMEFEAARI